MNAYISCTSSTSVYEYNEYNNNTFLDIHSDNPGSSFFFYLQLQSASKAYGLILCIPQFNVDQDPKVEDRHPAPSSRLELAVKTLL